MINKVKVLSVCCLVSLASVSNAFADSVRDIKMVNSSVGDNGNYRITCSSGKEEYYFQKQGVWHSQAYGTRISDRFDGASIEKVAREYVCR
jgi:hypothetical protein